MCSLSLLIILSSLPPLFCSSKEKSSVVVQRRVAKGHTGYLTFATVLHPEARSGGAEGMARAAPAAEEEAVPEEPTDEAAAAEGEPAASDLGATAKA